MCRDCDSQARSQRGRRASLHAIVGRSREYRYASCKQGGVTLRREQQQQQDQQLQRVTRELASHQRDVSNAGADATAIKYQYSA